ncbi:OmpW family outer membrane protein [Chelativorans sp.]|uniref:outer membrane protein n=1 Tax=Chelativorans sp. TaxID=2203393 RepID=UPI002810B27B|nr:OmpW family outer membrane protein [Chelativorans sp.]
MWKPCSLTLLVAAVAAAAALPAGAADYDPPLVLEDAPNYVPVEVGSGWYLRGDLTYNINESVYDLDVLGERMENTRFGGSVGFGYHFTDLLRADVNLAYLSRDKFELEDGLDEISAENRVLAAMVNGYFDLGTFVGVTPYVGAGAGVLYSMHEISVDSPTLGVMFEATDRQYEFAYALNAGVNYQVTQNLSVDLGYQYLSSPGTQYVDVDSGDLEKGLDYHQVKLGLRYDLW